MNGLIGTGTLLRLALRRDRIQLPVWLLAQAAILGGSGASIVDLYNTAAEQTSYARNTATSVVSLAFNGPTSGASQGAIVTAETITSSMLLAAFMTTFMVVRHTRQNEETGRAEMVGAGVVGRYASLAAAVVGLSFLLRAVGDSAGTVTRDGLYVESSWPSYLSPMGWIQQVRPFAEDTVLFLVPLAALFVALLVTAGFLTAHRDVGTGMLPVRPGPAQAPRSLRSPFGLAWRLQRASFVGWAAGILVLGLAFGAVADEVDDLVSGNADLEEVIAQLGGSQNLVDGYLSAIAGIFALLATGYVIQSLLRMRAEEAGGTLEPVLATAVSRARWVGAHVVSTVLGLAVLFLIAGAGMGFAYGIAAGDVAGETVRGVEAVLVRVPAALVIGAVVVLLFGALPRLAVALSWAMLSVTFVVMQLGAILDLPQIVLNASPFTHVPGVPAADVTVYPLVVLTLVALGVGGAGLLAFRRRDLAL
jgi:ABC-2 type transport system permease protein